MEKKSPISTREEKESKYQLTLKIGENSNIQSTSCPHSVNIKIEPPTPETPLRITQVDKGSPQDETQKVPLVVQQDALVPASNEDSARDIIQECMRLPSTLAEKLNLDLDVNPVKCVGDTTKHCRCMNSIAKKNAKEARLVMHRLQECDPILASGYVAEQLEILAGLLLCVRYHQKQHSLFTARWKAILQGPTQRPSTSNTVVATSLIEPTSSTEAVRSTVTVTESSIPQQDISFGREATYIATHTELQFSSTRIEITFSQNDGSQTRIRSLIPFDARAKSRGCTDDFVRGVIQKNLTPVQDQKSGLIYIYKTAGNFGRVKIGATIRTPEKRLQEWEKQCGHKAELIFPVTKEDREMVPHVFRVKKILQAQLRDCRRKELKCHKCKKRHLEWFERSVPEAITLVRKWAAWMRTTPYEAVSVQEGSDREDRQSVWRLKRNQTEKIQSLYKLEQEDQKRRFSTSQLKERTARLSVSPQRRRRAQSEEPPRRSARIATRRRSASITRSDPRVQPKSHSVVVHVSRKKALIQSGS
ncbi:MAG: hypothetical protein L6R37_007472 [Teloschistes peruensis]|nr:MAG: hypothetical protein L6R37_007472 [Teloschistes peruensis]